MEEIIKYLKEQIKDCEEMLCDMSKEKWAFKQALKKAIEIKERKDNGYTVKSVCQSCGEVNYVKYSKKDNKYLCLSCKNNRK